MSYSQNYEEEIIVGLLNAEKKVGHFLDIGAYDGFTFSNTLRLAELNWSGICVEPSPTVFPQLLKRHAANERITLVQAAIGSDNAFVEFWDSGGDALSTTDAAHRDKWRTGYNAKFTKMMVYTVTFANLFTQFGTLFDFINLDVEGVSASLFMRLPLQALEQCRVLCVEHDGKLSELQAYAARFGFQYVHHNGENLILAR
jgi:FkbM family methyltransferase